MTAELSFAETADDLLRRGIRRVHVLGWRDFADRDAGGSERHAHEFMSRFAAAGLQVTHRTSAAVGIPATEERSGYKVVRRGSRFSVFPRAAGSEILHRMGRYDALIEIWNAVPFMSPLWCRTPRIGFLHHVHGPMWGQILPEPFARLGSLMESRLAPPFYRSTTMLTPSDATRDELLALGFRPEKVTAVPNGVEPFFRPGGEKSHDPLVVAVGRLAPVKRFERMIEAAVVARRRVPAMRLVIVGEGPEMPRLEALVAEHGAHEWITFAGRLVNEALLSLYQQAWVVASASLAEGWGLTLTEAAACGTPAVATDISGHRCSVHDGITGVLAPVDHLGTAIADVLLDDAGREQMGKAALAWAQTLTWDSSALGVIRALHGEVVRHQDR
ncbi:MAG: putative glycosyltransferase [Ilumatobacteraceae bacterium]|nr:putative glycosyltransferase [Ilumatobacteraceae bacterium]